MPSILLIAPTPVPICGTTSKTSSKSVLTQLNNFWHDISYIHAISGKNHLKKPRPIIDHPCSPTWDSPAWFRVEGFKANPAGQLNCLPVSNPKVAHSRWWVFGGPTGDDAVRAPLFHGNDFPKPRFWPKLYMPCSRVTSWKLSTW